MIKYKSNTQFYDNLKVGTKQSAGIDLYCNEDKWIMPFSSAMVSLGISFELPTLSFGFLTPRSSTILTTRLNVVNGIIDSDYRGDIKAVFVNNGILPRKVKKGDRLVQLIIIDLKHAPFNEEFKKVEQLENTKRGDGGFGSTNK